MLQGSLDMLALGRAPEVQHALLGPTWAFYAAIGASMPAMHFARLALAPTALLVQALALLQSQLSTYNLVHTVWGRTFWQSRAHWPPSTETPTAAQMACMAATSTAAEEDTPFPSGTSERTCSPPA